MSDFFAEQGRTRVYGEAYFLYAATGEPRRTPLSGKIAISGRTQINADLSDEKRDYIICVCLRKSASYLT